LEGDSSSEDIDVEDDEVPVSPRELVDDATFQRAPPCLEEEASALASSASSSFLLGAALIFAKMMAARPEDATPQSRSQLRTPWRWMRRRPQQKLAEGASATAVLEFLDSITEPMDSGNTCVVLALVYLDRILSHKASGGSNGLEARRQLLKLDSSGWRPLLLASVRLADKVCNDDHFSNRYYAEVVGMSLEELNTLELRVSEALNFRLCVSPAEYVRYANTVSFVCKELIHTEPVL